MKDGDLIEATIEGNVIKGFVNGEEKITVSDDIWDSGAPGVGFNFGVGDTYADHGSLVVRGRHLGVAHEFLGAPHRRGERRSSPAGPEAFSRCR